MCENSGNIACITPALHLDFRYTESISTTLPSLRSWISDCVRKKLNVNACLCQGQFPQSISLKFQVDLCSLAQPWLQPSNLQCVTTGSLNEFFGEIEKVGSIIIKHSECQV